VSAVYILFVIKATNCIHSGYHDMLEKKKKVGYRNVIVQKLGFLNVSFVPIKKSSERKSCVIELKTKKT
jgi:hypothetical protein